MNLYSNYYLIEHNKTIKDFNSKQRREAWIFMSCKRLKSWKPTVLPSTDLPLMYVSLQRNEQNVHINDLTYTFQL